MSGIERKPVLNRTGSYDVNEDDRDLDWPDHRHYFECVECGHHLAEWTVCPDCGWYDRDAWERTMRTVTAGLTNRGQNAGPHFVGDGL